MCYIGKLIIFQIYEGKGIKPKPGLPTFCFGGFDVITRAVNSRFGLDTSSTHNILLFSLRSIVLQVWLEGGVLPREVMCLFHSHMLSRFITNTWAGGNLGSLSQ